MRRCSRLMPARNSSTLRAAAAQKAPTETADGCSDDRAGRKRGQRRRIRRSRRRPRRFFRRSSRRSTNRWLRTRSKSEPRRKSQTTPIDEPSDDAAWLNAPAHELPGGMLQIRAGLAPSFGRPGDAGRITESTMPTARPPKCSRRFAFGRIRRLADRLRQSSERADPVEPDEIAQPTAAAVNEAE